MDEKGELRAIITMMLNSLTSIDIKGKTLRYNHPAVGDPCLDASDHELHLLLTHKSQDSEIFKSVLAIDYVIVFQLRDVITAQSA